MKLLAVMPGHRLARERAAETLWPGAPPGRGLANLRRAAYFVRRATRQALLAPERDRIGLELAGVDVDLDRLEAAIATLSGVGPGRRALDGAALAVALAVALDLGGKELLPDDVYEDWLVAPREHVRHQWREFALRAARRLHRLGDAEGAMALVDRILAGDPADEAAHRLAIEVYASQGRHEAARRQLAECRAALRELVDAEPADETVATLAWLDRPAPGGRGSARLRRPHRSLKAGDDGLGI